MRESQDRPAAPLGRATAQVDLHAGVVFLVGGVGFGAQRASMLAALDDIDRDGNLTNTEVLVEPRGDGFRVRRFELP